MKQQIVTLDYFKQYVHEKIDEHKSISCASIISKFFIYHTVEKPATVTIKLFDYLYAECEKERAKYLNHLARGRHF